MSSKIAIAALLVSASMAAAAHADDYSNASSYNHGYGMAAGGENATAAPSLRDSNGNLSVVNGQFTSSNFSSQTGMTSSGSALQNLGNRSSGAAYGGATAIGNQLNVVTVGNWNTVVVNSHQTNTGTVTATTSTNGSNTATNGSN
ncbi:MAG TPA: holdfast anchoring protein HfaA [Rhizomicrobium sp.]|jgi:holdfast attachment protein HfaA|nr:holdfast anchoring protein HfaA [Rhizomicrobium sp.]